jgi:hypothetical protein
MHRSKLIALRVLVFTLHTLAPEPLFSLRRLATIESIGSFTRIEGSKLSNQEVEMLLGRLEIKQFYTRDAQDVAGHAEVLECVFSSWQPIGTLKIMSVHSMSMVIRVPDGALGRGLLET